jgi:DNA-binding NtrC family response regulator
MAGKTPPSARPRLLVVDDDKQMFPLLMRIAEPLGFDVAYRSNGPEALASLTELKPDVAMVDLQMPKLSGIDVLKSVRATDPACQVVLMTGNASIETAIEAVKAGALDYLSKPFDLERLRNLLAGIRQARDDREDLLRADAEVAERIDFHGMIGRSAGMQELFASIRRLAPHVRTVLVTGETGTGKELVAKSLHREGPRHDRRFLTVNCSAVVETLFESELFGHVRGAFTGATESKIGMFEHASGGTLFLDEVGELPRLLQPKLLRAVEHGEIQRVGSLEIRNADVCVIAATNRDLRAEAKSGQFRGDLFYRLGIIEIHLPPLRERREDIPILAAAFIREFSARFDRSITGLSATAERLLQQADWPGNVRELRNVLQRACIQASGGILTEREIVPAFSNSAAARAHTGIADSAADPERDSALLSTAQREQIRRVLQAAHGNKAAAAKLLGISRRSLYRWLDRLDLGE